MSKLRVYELARDLKIESKILVTRMKTIGIEVQSHQSTLTDDQIDKIKKLVSGESSEAGKAASGAAAGPRVIRRQRRPAETEVATADASSPPGDVAEAATSAAVAPSAPPTPAREVEETQVAESTPAPSKVAEPHVAAAPAENIPPVAQKEPVTPSATEVAAAKPQVSAPVNAQGDKPAPTSAPSQQSTVTANEALRRRQASSAPPAATIVRRATAEELAATAVRQAPQQRESFHTKDYQPRDQSRSGGGGGYSSDRRGPPRREDSRGTRIEGGGYTSGGGGGYSSGGSSGSSGGYQSRGYTSSGYSGGGYSTRAPDIGSPQQGDPGWDEQEDSRRRERDRIVKKVEGEETEEEKRNRIAKTKRASGINTRMLLNQIDDSEFAPDDGSLDDAPAPEVVQQQRTVYTPSATSRKKDLKRRKDLKRTQVTTPRAAYRIVKMNGAITVSDLAHQMSVKAADIIKKLMAQGLMATMNQSLDVDTTTLIAQEYGFEVENHTVTVEDVLAKAAPKETFSGETTTRSPIVTVMGHVDHGKTSILDAIRQENVAAGEAGGITQHIGAYTVTHNGKSIAFLDTPGHEAFSAMRARGASLTDIVILVVAADDGVMPQTIEAISHARAANVPIIVAVNKIDKPNTNLDRVYRELSEHGIQSEEWGGEHQFVKVSALQKIGLDELLEAILLQAEVLDLKAEVTSKAQGAVIEAHLDPGRGPIATVMVRNGTLNVGDYIVAGFEMGKVRAMNDHLGRRVTSAGPSTPVEVLGISGVPQAGDMVNSVSDERVAREVIGVRQDEKRRQAQTTSSAATLQELLGKIKKADAAEVALIVKADTQGSLEAIVESLAKLNSAKVNNRVVHRAVGGISDSDLALASATKAVIIGFNVRAMRGLDEQAERQGVIVKYFSIIYDVVDAVKSLMAGQLPPIVKEVILGHAEVRQSISVPKIGMIAGASVVDGKITRAAMLRLVRDQVVIYAGKIGSLRRFKDDVREVQQGYECGIGIDGYNDIKIGDVIEAFILEEHAATLE